MSEGQSLGQMLKELEEKRKNGSISASEFYKSLLELLSDLKDVLIKENIEEKHIRRQIPLLLTFLKSQIRDLSNRGN